MGVLLYVVAGCPNCKLVFLLLVPEPILHTLLCPIFSKEESSWWGFGRKVSLFPRVLYYMLYSRRSMS